MQRTLIAGDIHLHNWPAFADPGHLPGLNTRAEQIVRCVGAVLRQAEKHACQRVVFLGDIFETHKPSIALQHALAEQLVSTSASTILMVGNHDRISMSPDDHALAMFKHLPATKVIQASSITDDLVMIPWSTNNVTDEIHARLSHANADFPKVLCLHAGLYDKSEAPRAEQGNRDAHDAIEVNSLVKICRRYNIRRVFSGHWHAHREYTHGPELTITQLGALVPSGFNNAEHTSRYGQCVVVDEHLNVTPVQISGPRFLRATTLKGVQELVTMHEGYKPYISVKANVADMPLMRDYLTDQLSEGTIGGFIVEPSASSLQELATNVRVSVSKTSAEDAITDYISEMAPDADIAALASKVAITAWKRA